MENESLRSVRELAQVVLNPEVKELKSRALRGLLIPLLADGLKAQGIGTDTLQIELDARFGLANFPRILLEHELQNLVEEGVLEREGDTWILSEDEHKRFLSDKETTESLFSRFVEDLVRIMERREGILDDYEKVFVRKTIDKIAYGIFKALGGTVVAFATEQRGVSADIDLDELVEESTRDIKYPVLENTSKVKKAISAGLKEAFLNPTEDFSSGLVHLYGVYVMIAFLNADPEIKTFRKNVFEDACLVLDTNILVSLLCKSSERHEYTKWLLEATHEEGVELLASERTLKEFENSVEFAGYVYKRDHGHSLSEVLLMNEIARTYLLEYKNEMSWSEYVGCLERELSELMDEYSIRVIAVDEFELDELAFGGMKRVVEEYTSSWPEGRAPELVDHDAYCLFLIQQMRMSRPHRSFCSPWFLTHHVKLLKADRFIRDRWNFERESAIGPEVWFEILYPFLGPEVERKQVSVFFSRMVATNIVPIPPVSVKDFLRYISAEIDLSEEDEANLYRIVEARHLGTVLGEPLAAGDIATAIDTLYDAISDTLEIEKEILSKTDTIQRLVERNEELGQKVRELEGSYNIDIQDLKERIEAVNSASTSDEKKQALEDLAACLFGGVGGWRIVGRDRRTSTSELDIIVENSNRSDPFLIRMGADIPVECKNWKDPVGCDEIRDFGADIGKRGFQYGILVSKHGITGDPKERSFAHHEVWDRFRDGTSILVLSLDDIMEVVDGTSLVSILRTKSREVRLMG